MGEYLTGAANLVGAAGDVYSAFRKPQDQINPQLAGFRGMISTPGYNFGGGVLTRRNNDFRTGVQGLRSDIQGLRSQVRPGFGRLTESGVAAIRQKAAEASGNLRSQLARRGLLGASFAADQQTRLDAEYGQLENQFRVAAFQEEMNATSTLLDQEFGTIGALLEQDFKELGIAASFLSGVKQSGVTAKTIAQQMAEEALLDKYQSAEPTPAAAPAAPAAPAPAPAVPQQPVAAPRAPAGYPLFPRGGRNA